MKKSSLVLAAALIATVVLPAAADHYPQTRFQLSVGVGDNYIPNVEWNWQDDEYLAVWHHTPEVGYRSIKAQRIDSDGNLAGPTVPFGDELAERAHPSLAYNAFANEYLAVYMRDDHSGNGWEIWGQILNKWGGSISEEFFIGDLWESISWTPRVAWNSYRNEYAVVWYGQSIPTGSFGVVGFRRVSASGTITGDFVTVAALNFDQQCDIAYNLGQDEYLVVYASFPPESPNGEIRARRLSWDGVLQGTISVTPNDPQGARFPSVATNGQGLYVIAWEEYVGGDWDIRAQYHASSDGAAVGGPIYVSSWAGIDEAQPRVDVNGSTDQAMVVYESDLDAPYLGRKIEAAVINRFRSFPDLKFDVAAVPAWAYGDPAIAWGGTDYISVYTSNSSFTDQEIDGCMMGLVHVDGFESGDTGVWSDVSP